MKKRFKKTVALCLCACMMLTTGGLASASEASESTSVYSLDLNDYADQWEYREEEGTGYWALDVVYCANPVDVSYQHMIIYAPAAYMQENEDGTVVLDSDGFVTNDSGVTYTADTAPIMYTNTSGGYTSSRTEDVTIDYIKQGFVQVSIGTRGKNTQDEDGNYTGQLPLIVVDLKAGIRFLKANSDVVPGNPDRIVSHGYSSGGALSTVLGATGNSQLFESYLEEIGAADATDDIFIALCYCPITNLSIADAVYEWYQKENTSYYLFSIMAYDVDGNDISDVMPVGRDYYYTFGSNMLGGAHEDELSVVLCDWFVDYVQDLFGEEVLGDDGRSGEFFTEFVELYADALTEYVARYDDLDYTDEQYPTAEDYIQHLYDDYSAEEWLTWDEETQTAEIFDYGVFITSVISRNKMCPSLDSYNKHSPEADAFQEADGTRTHFSIVVRDALNELLAQYEEDPDSFTGFEDNDYVFTEDDLEYLEKLVDIYNEEVVDGSESEEIVEMMTPVNYIVNDDEYWESDLASYWRFQVGSNDGDQGLPQAWLTHNALLTYASDEISASEISVIWEKPHAAAEYDDQDLYDYINEVMTAEDDLPVSAQ